jgi:hypothetical protein
MKFSMFKKDKSKNKNTGDVEELSVQVTDLEEELNKGTSDLMAKEQELKTLSGTEDIKAVPHGPIGELKVEPGDTTGVVPLVAPVDAAVPPDAAADDIKVVEIKVDAVINKKEAKPEVAAPPPPPREEKKDESNQSLNSLFHQEEEEENPLANLIKGLPDVSADELMKDLNEIRDIIKEWQKKS